MGIDVKSEKTDNYQFVQNGQTHDRDVESNQPVKSEKPKGLGSVYLSVFIDHIGIGLIIPVIPYYALSMGASAFELGAMMSSYAAAQIVGSIVMGRVSDRLTRKEIELPNVLHPSIFSYVCNKHSQRNPSFFKKKKKKFYAPLFLSNKDFPTIYVQSPFFLPFIYIYIYFFF